MFECIKLGLKKFELLHRFWCFHKVMSTEDFHHSELFVGNTHDAYMPFWGKNVFYPLDMYLRIFPAGAVPQVYAELEHIEAVGHNIFPEPGIYFPILFSFCWQVKKYEYPHNSIGIESLKHHFYVQGCQPSYFDKLRRLATLVYGSVPSISGYNNFLVVPS
jgi:hypothetical protein